MQSVENEVPLEPLNLDRNATFLCFVLDDWLNALYKHAQFAVFSSIVEGFGITAIETLAAGTQVVGTDMDGIREFLQRGDNGRLPLRRPRRPCRGHCRRSEGP